MFRTLAIAAIGSVLLGCLPAQAQDVPELDGAPGPLKIPKTAPVQPKPAPVTPRSAPSKLTQPKVTQPKVTQPKAAQTGTSASAATKSQPGAGQLKATADRLAKQAEAQSVEAARLAQQAADLNSRQAALEVRAADLAAAEKRLADERARQDAALAAKQAELERKLAAASQAELERQVAARSEEAAAPTVDISPGRSGRSARLDIAAARRSCALEADAEARARNYLSASYDAEPRLNTRTMELRGLVRLDDRRGYRLVDSVCELSPEGEAEYFEFLR